MEVVVVAVVAARVQTTPPAWACEHTGALPKRSIISTQGGGQKHCHDICAIPKTLNTPLQ